MRTLFREANKPEPIEKADRAGFIKWGDNNLYPQFLNSIFTDNPIHGGIINQKVKFITAGGITIEGENGNSIETNGGSPYSLQEVVDALALDYEIGDSFTAVFKKSLTTNLWYCEAMDFELIRATENGIYFDYSDDWSVSRQGVKTGYRKIKNIHYVTEEDKECILVKQSKPKQRILGDYDHKKLSQNYYASPNYSGAITSIMAGIEMDFFTYSEVVNGYKGGVLINLANGVPDSPQEEDNIIKRVKNESSARNTQGGSTITFSDGKDRAPEVHQMNGNDLDKRYIESSKEILRKIMIAHGVISPALFGVLSETMFGSNEEMVIAYGLFQENYVEYRQRGLADSLNWAFKRLNGFTGEIVFNNYVPASLQKEVVTEQEDVVTEEEKMSNELDLILDLFSKTGKERGDIELLNSRSYTGQTDEDFKAEYRKNTFASSLTESQQVILKMIKDGESYPAINKALGKGGNFLSNELVNLGNLGLLDGWELTSEGAKASIIDIDLEVVYSYEKKATAPDLVKGGTSRDFCKALIQMDRLYTRQEIDMISGTVGRDVWSYRGGWYHNPKTNVNTPSCRHEWRQALTIK